MLIQIPALGDYVQYIDPAVVTSAMVRPSDGIYPEALVFTTDHGAQMVGTGDKERLAAIVDQINMALAPVETEFVTSEGTWTISQEELTSKVNAAHTAGYNSGLEAGLASQANQPHQTVTTERTLRMMADECGILASESTMSEADWRFQFALSLASRMGIKVNL